MKVKRITREMLRTMQENTTVTFELPNYGALNSARSVCSEMGQFKDEGYRYPTKREKGTYNIQVTKIPLNLTAIK